jgi:hypothetical protein
MKSMFSTHPSKSFPARTLIGRALPESTFPKMNLSKFILLLFTLGTIALSVACVSTHSGSSHPTIDLSTVPTPTPTSLTINATLSLTATVSNDPGNGIFNWSATCGSNTSGGCGTFSPTNTASGAAVTYTAPAAIPPAAVVITANLTQDSAIYKSAPAITITGATSIAFSPAPPTLLAPGATSTISATVINDASSGGVTWSCTPTSACGSFSSGSSAVPSDTSVTYTAPSALGNFTLTATSADDASVSTSANVTVTNAAAGILPSGNYVFFLSGYDLHYTPYFVAGTFTVSTSGSTMTITGGEQDFSDDYNEKHDPISTASTIAHSSSTGDHNLIVTLQTGDPCIGPGANTACSGGNGQEILSATLTSGSNALIIEYDTWGSASGTLDLQSNSLSTPSGGYAFYLTGQDRIFQPLALGGVLDIDNSGGTGGISGAGSIFDLNDAGSASPAESFTASSVSTPPDPYGFVTFSLNSPLFTTSPGITLAGYMIDNSHIQLVETSGDFLKGTTGGNALAQTGAGSFSSGSLSGSSYVLDLIGTDNVGTVQIAGLITFNSDGSLTGNLSFNDTQNQSPQGGSTLAAEVNATPCSSGSAATPCYTIEPTGRVTITNLTDNATTPTFAYDLQLYLDGNGQALVVAMVSTFTNSPPTGAKLPNGLAGVAYQQSSGSFAAASLLGSYALNIDQQNPAGAFEYDGVGTIAANGVSALNGYLDLNGLLATGLTPSPDEPASGNFAVTKTNGIFTGIVSGISSHGVAGNSFTYYVVSPTKTVAIENDEDQLTLGLFELQQ